MDLADIWPPFLDCLDSDPQRAQSEFYQWALKYFAACPPSPITSLPRQDWERVCHDVGVDCIVDDFRILRKYKNQGKPFAGWFMLVSRHMIIDRIRSIKRTPDVVHRSSDSSNSFSVSRHGKAKTVIEQHTLRRILTVVDECIQQMNENCQILLRLAAEEHVIPEILGERLVGETDNKKLSGKIQYCRKQLKKLVRARGVEISKIL